MGNRLLKPALAVLFIAAVYVPIALYNYTVTAVDSTMVLCDLLGLIALSLLVCAVTLTSRIRPLTRTIKLIQLVWTHKFLGATTVVFVLIHLALVIVEEPAKAWLLDPWRGTPASRAATASTLLLLGLAGMGRLRSSRPEVWRWLHITFSAGSLTLAGLHVFWLNHLIKVPELRIWFVVCAAAVIGALANRWVVKPLRYLRSSYRVVDVIAESSTTSTIVLTPSGSRHSRHRRSMPQFHPGQYAWLRLHAVPTAQERPFTICSSAQNTQELRFTIRTVGAFSKRLSQLTRGRRVWVDGPHGAFRVPEDSVGTVSIVAGVGITPVMSILRTLADRGNRHPHRLLVGARYEDDLLLRPEIERLRSRLNLSVTEALTRPDQGWLGKTGRIDARMLAEWLPAQPQRRHLDYFVCGPQQMALNTVGALTSLGVPQTRINVEYLEAASTPKKTPQRRTIDETAQSNEDARRGDVGPSTNPIGIRVGQRLDSNGSGSHRFTADSGAHRVVPAPDRRGAHRAS